MHLCNEEMLDVGLGVRLIIGAAPVPPVPAPPGKPPFPLSSSSSSLRRRCSSWWFSNGNAHGRDTTTSSSSRATRRRWWSDPDGSQEDYGSSSLEEEDGYDYEDEAAFSGFGWAGELFDESWFSKVFKTYGFILPVMLTSMFAATGLKAFLMAMAIPLSQSAISFLLRRKRNRDDSWSIFFRKNYRWRRPFQEEEYPEDATDFATGGRGKGYSSSSYYEGRRRRNNYQSWVSKDFADAASTAVGAGDNTKSNSSGDGGGNKSSVGYGGWDELLDNNNTAAAAREAKKSSNHSQLATLIRARNRGLQRLARKMRILPPRGRRVQQGVGAPPERMRMRRRGIMPRTMGLGSTRYKPAPLLMRLLVAVIPFLGSWLRLL